MSDVATSEFWLEELAGATAERAARIEPAADPLAALRARITEYVDDFAEICRMQMSHLPSEYRRQVAVLFNDPHWDVGIALESPRCEPGGAPDNNLWRVRLQRPGEVATAMEFHCNSMKLASTVALACEGLGRRAAA